jgi:hypothetical protein
MSLHILFLDYLFHSGPARVVSGVGRDSSKNTIMDMIFILTLPIVLRFLFKHYISELDHITRTKVHSPLDPLGRVSISLCRYPVTFHTFYGTRKSVTGLYPEPDESSPHPPTHVFKFLFNIILRGVSVSIVCDYRWHDRGSIPGRGKIFFPVASVTRPALRSTQPPIQWVPAVLSRG